MDESRSLEHNALLHRKPVQLVEHRGDMIPSPGARQSLAAAAATPYISPFYWRPSLRRELTLYTLSVHPSVGLSVPCLCLCCLLNNCTKVPAGSQYRACCTVSGRATIVLAINPADTLAKRQMSAITENYTSKNVRNTELTTRAVIERKLRQGRCIVALW